MGSRCLSTPIRLLLSADCIRCRRMVSSNRGKGCDDRSVFNNGINTGAVGYGYQKRQILNYMKLQDQVCTPIQGANLAEYGINQSVLVHVCDRVDGKYIGVLLKDDEGISKTRSLVIPAFSVAELGAMLPGGAYSQDMHDKRGAWWAYYSVDKAGDWSTEARARASLLIHLLQFGIVRPHDVKSRLNA